MSLRPHLHATATLSTTGDWKTDDEQLFEAPVSPSSAYIVDSPSSVHPDSRLPSSDAQYPSREAPDDEYISQDFDNAHSTARSPKVPSLPDPSQYPDPYPYKPRYWHHTVSTPTLSSADSASASTRSSAYTNSARSGDYGHVHVALGTEDLHANGGISSDDVAQLLAREAGLSSSSAQSRTTIADANRWSYAHSARSRSSSVGNGNANQDVGSPALRGAPSYDQGWDPVEEKDELGLTSEDETDDDAYLGEDHDDDEEEVTEATSAMMIAEEGRGVIVRGTDGPIVQLQVQPGVQGLIYIVYLFGGSQPSHFYSYYPSIDRVLYHSQCCPCILDQRHPSHCNHAVVPRYIRQLPRGSSACTLGLYMLGGAQYCVQSSSGAPRLPCRTHFITGPHCGLDGTKHIASGIKCYGQAAFAKHSPQQNALSSELVVSFTVVGDTSSGWKSISWTLEGSRGASIIQGSHDSSLSALNTCFPFAISQCGKRTKHSGRHGH